MKKVFFILLSMILVFAMVACDGDSATSPSTGNSVTMPVSKEEGINNLFAAGASDGEHEISRSIEHGGFNLTLTLTDEEDPSNNEKFVIGGKNDVYWIATDKNENGSIDETEYMFATVKGDGHSWGYAYSAYSDVWEAEDLSEEDPLFEDNIIDTYFLPVAEAILYQTYNEELLSMLKKGSATENINGRTCTRYYMSESYGGFSISIDYYVDNELGILMELKYLGGDSLEIEGFSYDVALDYDSFTPAGTLATRLAAARTAFGLEP